jgi:hypothetical protein
MPIYEVQMPPDILRRRGAIFPVEISLPQTLIDYLTAQKMQVPPPVSGSALIDSGASISAIDSSVVSALQISPIGVATVLTPAGPAKQNLFPARFILSRLRIDISAVIGVDLKPQGIIALIGRDILSRFLMIYHGPGGRVTLSF